MVNAIIENNFMQKKALQKCRALELKILKILDYYASLTFTAFNPFRPS